MATPSGPAYLLGQIVDVLASASGPMNARDIADRLGPLGDSELRQEVLRALNGPLQAFVRKDSQERWTLVRRPSIATGADRHSAEAVTGCGAHSSRTALNPAFSNSLAMGASGRRPCVAGLGCKAYPSRLVNIWSRSRRN